MVYGHIIDEDTGLALNKVKIELVHTDKEGFYFREEGSWNPRIFAYLQSNEKLSILHHTDVASTVRPTLPQAPNSIRPWHCLPVPHRCIGHSIHRIKEGVTDSRS